MTATFASPTQLRTLSTRLRRSVNCCRPSHPSVLSLGIVTRPSKYAVRSIAGCLYLYQSALSTCMFLYAPSQVSQLLPPFAPVCALAWHCYSSKQICSTFNLLLFVSALICAIARSENKQIPHYKKPSPFGRRCRRMPTDEGQKQAMNL